MNRNDFIRLIGAERGEAEYLPVAVLLRSGYACAGYYNASLNEDMVSTCVLLNARLMELKADSESRRPTLCDFNEFLEEIVGSLDSSEESPTTLRSDAYGPSIPLTVVPYEEIAVLYPVAQISTLVQRAREVRQGGTPSFLDLNKSELVRLLRTRIW
jgi:hypothetical protein